MLYSVNQTFKTRRILYCKAYLAAMFILMKHDGASSILEVIRTTWRIRHANYLTQKGICKKGKTEVKWEVYHQERNF